MSEVVRETPRVVTLVLRVPGWPGHLPGQHVDVRLTGEDGSEAQRLYSIASAPEEPLVALTVERIPDGEVSPYLVSEVRAGDQFADIIYREELDRLASKGDGLTVVQTLTRARPSGWTGGARRIDRAMLAEVGFPASARPHVFICGPTSLVESAGQLLLDLGHEPNLVKTERFGPSGS